MKSSEMVVLADATRLDRARQIWDGSPVDSIEWPGDVVDGGRLLKDEFGRGRRLFVVFGGDDLAGRVTTAYRRRGDLGSRPLKIWPLDVGTSFLAADKDGVDPARAAKLTKKPIEDWRRRQVGTLKVSASTEPAAWYGFSFGAGWIYRATESRKRARGGSKNFFSAYGRLATETLTGDDDRPVALRVAVDHRPVDEASGSMIASTLQKTMFGLGAGGDGAVVWEGVPTSTLVRRGLTPEVLDRSDVGGERFDSLHLDSPEGWFLDGRLHGSDDPGVVQIVSGPTVTVMQPQVGLRAAVRGLLN